MQFHGEEATEHDEIGKGNKSPYSWIHMDSKETFFYIVRPFVVVVVFFRYAESGIYIQRWKNLLW